MRRLRSFLFRLADLFGRTRRDRDLAAELESHLQLHIDDNLRVGMTPEAARRAALMKLGGIEQTVEGVRDRRAFATLATVAQDIRYAGRTLKRARSFALVALVTLALGIGANTAVFSVIDGVLLHPIPFPAPDRLLALYGTSPRGKRNGISYPDLLDWRREAHTLEVAGWRNDRFSLTGRGTAEQLTGLMVSADFFDILRVVPIVGRTFRSDEDRLGAMPVVLLGEGLWKRRFFADPQIVGQHLTLNGQDHAVIGVVPSNVRIARIDSSIADEVFTPLGQYDDKLFHQRGVNQSLALARLRPGATLAQAKTELSTIAANLAIAYPANKGIGVNMLPLEQDVAGDLTPVLIALSGAVGFLLLIACANVASLSLARTTGRYREFALRAALGASRGRLFRQLLTESALVGCAGGLLGAVLAAAGTRAALSVLPSALPAISHIVVNLRVLLFAFGLSLATAILFGLVPALKAAGMNLQGSMQQGGRGGGAPRLRLQRVLIMVEVALTLVLLVGTGLMLGTLARLWQVNPGFDPKDVLSFYTKLTPTHASTPDRVRAALRELDDRLAALPGVQSASVHIGSLPLTGSGSLAFRREDRPRPANVSEMLEATFYAVGPDHFETMRIPLMRGRAFARQDDGRGPLVTIVDEELARSVFPDENPIGKRIVIGAMNRPLQIVGIAGHVKHAGLDSDARASVRSQFYMPYTQLPDILATMASNEVAGLVRSTLPPAVLMNAIRREISAFDTNQVVHTERTMTEIIAASLARRRFLLILLAVFAAIAVVLSIVGVYGVVSYLVAQRTHEFGVRIALGAQPRTILAQTIVEGGRPAVIGVAIGLALSVATTRFLSAQLFAVSPTDPATFAAVAVGLLAVALFACIVPAHRAMRVDPMVALRHE